MSLLLLAVATAAGAAAASVGWAVWRGTAPTDEERDEREPKQKEAPSPERAPVEQIDADGRDDAEHSKEALFGALHVCRRDVVVSTSMAFEGEPERWLEHASVAADGERPHVGLFWAPEQGSRRLVVAWPRPRRELDWLGAPQPLEIGGAAEPPTTLEIDGHTWERRSRLPVAFHHALGGSRAGVIQLGTQGMVAEYAGGGQQVAWVLIGGVAERKAWIATGRRLGPHEFEVWGGANPDAHPGE